MDPEPHKSVKAGIVTVALRAADVSLHILHLAVALFCVIGWAFTEARVANLVLMLLIALSWIGLGIFFGYGYGYCLITDIQWRVKQKLGKRPSTDSFVKYQLDKITRRNLDPRSVETFTQLSFYVSALASLYVNFIGLT